MTSCSSGALPRSPSQSPKRKNGNIEIAVTTASMPKKGDVMTPQKMIAAFCHKGSSPNACHHRCLSLDSVSMHRDVHRACPTCTFGVIDAAAPDEVHVSRRCGGRGHARAGCTDGLAALPGTWRRARDRGVRRCDAARGCCWSSARARRGDSTSHGGLRDGVEHTEAGRADLSLIHISEPT